MTSSNRGSVVVRVLSVLGLAAALGLVGVAEASAQKRVRAKRIQTVRPEVHVSLGPGFGTGMRLDIALVPDGFLDQVEDEFALSPGFEFFFVDFHHHDNHFDDDHHGHSGLTFSPHVVAQWNFYLHDAWSVFPELGIAFLIGDDFSYHHHHHGGGRNDHAHFYVDPVIGGGARWHFSDRGSLVFRLVWPFGFQFGVTF